MTLKFVTAQLKYSSIDSDYGLAPTRRQTIIWTNVGNITDAYMRDSASVSQRGAGLWRHLANMNVI